jgi:WD40-like Beta Propeller Repeat
VGRGTNVDFERGLNAAVARLRQALSDSAENPKYVETVARRGYRFIAPIGELAVPKPARRTRIWPGIAAAAALVLFAALWWGFSHGQTSSAELQMRVVPLTADPGIESSPSFSPDGDQVAYLWDKGEGKLHVYVKSVGPGDPIQLTCGSERFTRRKIRHLRPRRPRRQ